MEMRQYVRFRIYIGSICCNLRRKISSCAFVFCGVYFVFVYIVGIGELQKFVTVNSLCGWISSVDRRLTFFTYQCENIYCIWIFSPPTWCSFLPYQKPQYELYKSCLPGLRAHAPLYFSVAPLHTHNTHIHTQTRKKSFLFFNRQIPKHENCQIVISFHRINSLLFRRNDFHAIEKFVLIKWLLININHWRFEITRRALKSQQFVYFVYLVECVLLMLY